MDKKFSKEFWFEFQQKFFVIKAGGLNWKIKYGWRWLSLEKFEAHILISNKSEQLKFKLEKIIGIEKNEGKVRKILFF